MLIEFRFKNYRSFRDEAVLSMEASGYGMYKNSLISVGAKSFLPAAALFGKNGLCKDEAPVRSVDVRRTSVEARPHRSFEEIEAAYRKC